MRWLRRALAFVVARRLTCFLLAALVLLPVFAMPQLMLPGGTFAYLFVIDVSESMNVRDVDVDAPNESRLDRAKASVIAAMANLPCGSRVSVALFAGVDTVTLFEPLEVCRHFPAVEQVVSHVDWRMAWDGDSRIEAGVVNALREAQQRGLDLVFLSDYDEAPHVEVPHLSDLLGMAGKTKGWLVGVGSFEEKPVPRLDADNNIVGYWTATDAARQGFHPNLVEMIESAPAGADLEKSGALAEVGEHRSALRADYMKQLAKAGGLGYVTADSVSRVATAANDRSTERREKGERDMRIVFGLAAALLVASGWIDAERTRKRSDRRSVRVRLSRRAA